MRKTSGWSKDAAKDYRNSLPSMQRLLEDGVVAQWLLEDSVVRSIIVSGSENHRRSGPYLYSLDASYPITELHIIMRCHDGQLCRMQDSVTRLFYPGSLHLVAVISRCKSAILSNAAIFSDAAIFYRSVPNSAVMLKFAFERKQNLEEAEVGYECHQN